MSLNFKQKSGAARRIAMKNADFSRAQKLRNKKNSRQNYSKNSPGKQSEENLQNNKSLGQHWLRDREILDAIVFEAEITDGDFALEIGPGLGTLTSSILRAVATSGQVLAIEFDPKLAQNLPKSFPGKNLEVLNADFLDFDLDKLPSGYKVAANVPYYITSKIVEKLLTAHNKPSVAALLVQKEVAERMAAQSGNLSVLGVATQIYAEAELGSLVPREFFTPPPKVDSQVIILKIRQQNLLEKFNRETSSQISEEEFFRVVKAGFSSKRKKIAKSLSANFAIPREKVEEILAKAEISPDLRAQDLSIQDWLTLAKIWQEK